MLYGGIEAGGTKFVCAVGTGPDDIQATARFPTTTPAETMQKAIDFFQSQPTIAALGIASFGPVDLNPDSATYGYITTTPKPGWTQADLVGTLKRALNVPIGFDTDVNGAALGEYRWGAAQGLDTFVYLTIGTGLGGGAMVNGSLAHGLIHPEMGHFPLPHDWEADPFAGHCPFHGDCWEGMVSGPAMAARWGQPAETLPLDHPAWALEAHYIGVGLATIICILSPQRIILGGGVMSQSHLFPLVRAAVQKQLNGYVQAPQIVTNDINSYIVPPGLGNLAGISGAIALAETAVS